MIASCWDGCGSWLTGIRVTGTAGCGRCSAGGEAVNVKRVRRLCVKDGLSLRHRVRRKRKGLGGSVPRSAEHVNHVWTYDFVHDRCENGRKLKMLTVVTSSRASATGSRWECGSTAGA